MACADFPGRFADLSDPFAPQRERLNRLLVDLLAVVARQFVFQRG